MGTLRLIARGAVCALLVLANAGCQSNPARDSNSTTGVKGPAPSAQSAATVYFNGDILTMAGESPTYVESLVVREGRIVYVGSAAAAMSAAGDDATRIDLQGRTMLPGFIDTHGHFIYFGKNLVDADLFGTKNVGEVIERMKRHAPNVPEGAWIVGFGYLSRKLAEQRTPTIEELDAVSLDRPVLIVDSSGHLGAANSAAFRAAGIKAATPDPVGGSFTRKTDGKSLAGPMEETALNAVREHRPAFTGALADQVVIGASKLWASYGQTTAMECGLGLGNDDIALVRNAIDRQLLPLDLYVCAKNDVSEATIAAAKQVGDDYRNAEAGSLSQRQDALVAQANSTKGEGAAQRLLAGRADLDRRYVNRVRLGGIKFWLDGSTDTAWFTRPYAHNPPGKTGSYSGFRQIPDDVLDAAFDQYWTSGLQINMHMNGDAAADQALNAIEKAIRKHGMADHRPVFIHASYVRPDQVARMKAVGAVPSFLSMGLVGGGDGAVHLWGPERAAHAMAAGTMKANGMPYTFSHDAPVSPQPAILALVDAGVNRTTDSGKVVGPGERVPAYDALKAVTAHAAYQIKEENMKGTLEAGKLADLVILERNPLKVDPKTIKDIRVLQTIKEGVPVFTAEARSRVAHAPGPVGAAHDCVHDDAATHETPLDDDARGTVTMLMTAARSAP